MIESQFAIAVLAASVDQVDWALQSQPPVDPGVLPIAHLADLEIPFRCTACSNK
jgi:hypothetical protein